jgi:hypothetical protein
MKGGWLAIMSFLLLLGMDNDNSKNSLPFSLALL